MKSSLTLFINLLLLAQFSFGQSITIIPENPQNPTKGTLNYDNPSNLLRYWNGSAWVSLTNAAGTGWAANGKNIYNANAGNVGIGISAPQAYFNVAPARTVIFGKDSTSDDDTKLIWYSTKGALRVGLAGATGFGSLDVGLYSMALGQYTHAGGDAAFSTGYLTYAFGNASTAMGSESKASGENATAIGVKTNATGDNSTALGVNSNTSNHRNSFCIAGTANDAIASNTSDNQMMMRFDNYTFWVTSVNYAYLTPQSNGWAYTSDRNKKENFEELNGETVLKKISAIPYYSWNFKAKDTRQYRHYGIMAQDFYQAFGRDDYGTIGNDTTVSPLDLLGVAYSGIKALEKRTEVLQAQNQYLMEEIESLKAMLQPKRRKSAFRKSKEPIKSENLIVKQ
ncbi:tail fiber domain-containing protein [Emticicia fontis]